MKDAITAAIVLSLLYGGLYQANQNQFGSIPDRPDNGLDLLMRCVPTYWIGRALVKPFNGRG